MTELKQRPGDQPLPVPNEHPDVQSMVIADVAARREVGISRYRTALQAFNGRDGLRDAFEEALDLTVYLRQLIAERDAASEPAVGNRPAVDGTGESFGAVATRTAKHLQRSMEAGCHTWADQARADLYTALAEPDPAALRAKVAALTATCEAWAADLERRAGA